MKEIFIAVSGIEASACRHFLQDAVAMATHKRSLFFGIVASGEGDGEALVKAAAPAGCSVFFMAGDTPLQTALEKAHSLYSGQAYALQLLADFRFMPGWDDQLRQAIALCSADNPLLSCRVSLGGVPCAIGVKGFTPEGRLRFRQGMPLVNAIAPPKGAFLSSDFVLGKGEWIHTARQEEWHMLEPTVLSLQAFSAKYDAYTMHAPIFADAPPFTNRTPDGFLQLPENALTALPQFEGFTDISFSEHKVSSAAYLGIFTPDRTYPVQVSLETALYQWRRARRTRKAKEQVMFITAMGDTPATSMPTGARLTSISHLAELKHLPVTCYGAPDKVRALQAFIPNTYGLKAGKAPVSGGPLVSYGPAGAFARSKTAFLLKGATQFPHYTHYGWIDLEYQRHPLYKGTAFGWRFLQDGKIHLAKVWDRPDTSLFIVPRERLPWLAQHMAVLEAPGEEQGDEVLFLCLIATYPDAFTLHPMIEPKRLLTLAMKNSNGGNVRHDEPKTRE